MLLEMLPSPGSPCSPGSPRSPFAPTCPAGPSHPQMARKAAQIRKLCRFMVDTLSNSHSKDLFDASLDELVRAVTIGVGLIARPSTCWQSAQVACVSDDFSNSFVPRFTRWGSHTPTPARAGPTSARAPELVRIVYVWHVSEQRQRALRVKRQRQGGSTMAYPRAGELKLLR
jgi:hypothetical protein